MTAETHGNLRFDEVNGVPVTRATGPLAAEDLALLRVHSDRRLILCYLDGWCGEPLGFLADVPHLRELFLLVNRTLDVTPVSRLSNLESLQVLCPTTGVLEFGNLGKLKVCELRWQGGMSSVFELSQLQALTIDAYIGHDLTLFQKLEALQLLKVYASRLHTSAGVGSLAALRTLDLRGCRRLAQLDEVERLTELEVLNVEGDSQLKSIAPAFSLPKLRRLLAGDCPRLESICGIERLRALEELHLVGSTRIADNNLAPLLKLPSLRKLCIAWRKGYSPPESEFAAFIPK